MPNLSFSKYSSDTVLLVAGVWGDLYLFQTYWRLNVMEPLKFELVYSDVAVKLQTTPRETT